MSQSGNRREGVCLDMEKIMPIYSHMAWANMSPRVGWLGL